MKNKFYLFVGLILLAGCSADPALGPIITVETAEVGAFPRTVELKVGEYDLMDLSGSSYLHDIDFRSIDGGNNVANYIINVSFDDNNSSNGDDSTTPIEFKNFTQSDFGDSGNGTKSLTLDFPFLEVVAAVGVASADVLPGDRFQFTAELILDDGRVFTSANTESTIFGPAFRAFFDWNVNATCPLDNALFVGAYDMAFVGPDGSAWPGAGGGRSVAETVTLSLVPGATTLRTFTLGVLPRFGPFGTTITLEWVCDVVGLQSNFNVGVGCGSPAIFIKQGTQVAANIMDDSVININWVEDGGGCGYSFAETAVLTKQ